MRSVLFVIENLDPTSTIINKWESSCKEKVKVGVGGLEPPTSASQTQRAGQLRYTPAQQSIIAVSYTHLTLPTTPYV